MLLVEDGHWCDADSERALALAVTDRDLPLAVVVTCRPADDGSPMRLRLAPDTPVRAVALTRLQLASVRRLAERVAGGPIGDDLAELLDRKAGGNPFFIEQWLALPGGRRADPGGAGGDEGAPAELEMPDDLNSLLAARLDRLPPATRRAVQEAAVLGHEFDVRVLRAMRRDAAEPEGVVEGAVRERLWEPLDEHRLRFRHALLRDAAYGMQAMATRRERHARAGRAIAALHAGDPGPWYGALARHYDLAEDAARAAEFLDKAAARAQSEFKNLDALRHLRRLLARLPGGDARRAPIRLRAGRVLQLIGEWTDAEAEYRAALEAEPGPPPAIRAKGCLALGDLCRLRGDYEAGEPLLRRALALAEESGQTECLLDAWFVLGNVHEYQSRHEEALECYRRMLARAEAGGRPRHVARAHGGIGITCAYLGRHDEAMRHFRVWREVAVSQGDLRGEGHAIGSIGNVHNFRGEPDRALPCYRRQIEIARETGDLWTLASAVGNLGQLYADHGRPDEAMACFLFTLEQGLSLGERRQVAFALASSGALLRERGERERAEALLARAEALCEAINFHFLRAEVLRVRGTLLVESGRGVEAEPLLERSCELAERIRKPSDAFASRLELLVLRAAKGEAERRAACSALEAMRGEWTEAEQRAEIERAAWRILSRAEPHAAASHARRAAEAFRALHAAGGRTIHARRLAELTGESPPAPAPLPSPPGFIADHAPSLDPLLSRVDRLLESLAARR